MPRVSKAEKTTLDNGVKIAFSTGQEITATLDEFSDEMVNNLAIHGLTQKLGDSYAGGEVDEAFPRCKAVYEALVKGEWSTRVAGVPRVTQLAKALANATGHSIEEAEAKIDEMDDEAIKAIRKHPAIKVELAKIKAEAAAAAAAKATEEAAGSDIPELTI